MERQFEILPTDTRAQVFQKFHDYSRTMTIKCKRNITVTCPDGTNEDSIVCALRNDANTNACLIGAALTQEQAATMDEEHMGLATKVAVTMKWPHKPRMYRCIQAMHDVGYMFGNKADNQWQYRANEYGVDYDAETRVFTNQPKKANDST